MRAVPAQECYGQHVCEALGSRAEASFYTESDAAPGTAPDYLRHVGLSP